MRVLIAFALPLAPALAAYGTYIGDADDQVAKVITDATGNTYVTGSTRSPSPHQRVEGTRPDLRVRRPDRRDVAQWGRCFGMSVWLANTSAIGVV
jgi:hypothetical protein